MNTNPSRADNDDARPALWGWMLAAILALGAVLRVIEARRNPLAFEEIYITLLARTGFLNTLRTLSHDVDQPLYHLLLGLWRRIGGEGELWLKSLNISLGLATVWIVFALGRRLFGTRAGLLAALLLAVHNTHIYFSQYANVDALLWLLLPLAALRLLAWRDKPTWANAAWFAVAGAAAMYTYYFGFFILLAMVLWGMVTEPRRALAWLVPFGLALLLFGPQLPILAGQLTLDFAFIRKLPILPLADVIHAAVKIANTSPRLAPVLFLIALVPLFVGTRRREALLPLIVLVFPAALVFTMSQLGYHIFFQRQLLYGIPFAAVAVGAGLAAVRPRVAGPLVALAVAALALHTWQGRAPLDEAIDLKRAGEYLSQHAAPGEQVLCCETHSLLYLQYHFPRLGPYRLLQPPEASEYHVSDGILVVADSTRMGTVRWEALQASKARWWGARVEHFPYYRTGAEAAARIQAQAGPPVWTYRKATVWAGGASAKP
jgi:mannosyltransferase